jgi:hypothetical protein
VPRVARERGPSEDAVRQLVEAHTEAGSLVCSENPWSVTLNDAMARATGVRVRETVPDTFLDRADEVINVDVTVEELCNRLREGHVYRSEKVEQALTNSFRKGNLSTLRELALRAVADDVSEKAARYRAREGFEPALIPERVDAFGDQKIDGRLVLKSDQVESLVRDDRAVERRTVDRLPHLPVGSVGKVQRFGQGHPLRILRGAS